jgi:hypothetical protein
MSIETRVGRNQSRRKLSMEYPQLYIYTHDSLSLSLYIYTWYYIQFSIYIIWYIIHIHTIYIYRVYIHHYVGPAHRTGITGRAVRWRSSFHWARASPRQRRVSSAWNPPWIPLWRTRSFSSGSGIYWGWTHPFFGIRQMMIKVILPIDFAYNDKKISPGYISRPQGWWCVFKRLFLMTIIRFGGNFYFDSVSIWYGAKPKGHQTKVFIHIQKDGSRLFIHFWTITWTIGHQGFEQPYPRFQQCLMFFISWNDLCLMVQTLNMVLFGWCIIHATYILEALYTTYVKVYTVNLCDFTKDGSVTTVPVTSSYQVRWDVATVPTCTVARASSGANGKPGQQPKGAPVSPSFSHCGRVKHHFGGYTLYRLKHDLVN